jgi:RNA polymerase sigma-70 factor (ECF subfamily)
MTDSAPHAGIRAQVATDDRAFQAQLIALIPHLRAFARSLCRDVGEAEDLAQDAMLKAWQSRSQFELGTNLKAWMFMILRNLFYSEKRRSWRREPLDQEVAERTLVAIDDPSSPLELADLRRAMNELSVEQREALILIGAAGLSYEDAAQVTGCAIGTIKSRVSRARDNLRAILAVGDMKDGDVAPRYAFSAIMADAGRLGLAA